MTWQPIAPAGNTPDNLSMVNISIKYTGDLHCDATHGPSHAKVATDAPTDNKGKGEAFSPRLRLAPVSARPWD